MAKLIVFWTFLGRKSSFFKRFEGQKVLFLTIFWRKNDDFGVF